MLGQVEKVTTRSNLSKVITQHTCCIENDQKKKITSRSTLVRISDQLLHRQVTRLPSPKGTFRGYAVREIISFDEHGPISGHLYGGDDSRLCIVPNWIGTISADELNWEESFAGAILNGILNFCNLLDPVTLKHLPS